MTAAARPVSAKVGENAQQAEQLTAMLMTISRLCVRQGISRQTVGGYLDSAFIEVTRDEIEAGGVKVTYQAVALLSGLDRRKTSKQMQQPRHMRPPLKLNSACIIMQRWQTDPFYSSPADGPLDLPLHGLPGPSFESLCRHYTKNINGPTVLSWLTACGCVNEDAGIVKFVEQKIVVKNDEQLTKVAMTVTAYFNSTTEHNLSHKDPKDRLLQRYSQSHVIPDHLLKDFQEKLAAFAEKKHFEIFNFIERYEKEHVTQQHHDRGAPGSIAAGVLLCFYKPKLAQEIPRR